MKKLAFVLVAVALLAAACNSSQSVQTNSDVSNGTIPATVQTENAQQMKVDTIVNSLNASVDGEQTINSQSNDDVINSDQTDVDSEQQGVTNATK